MAYKWCPLVVAAIIINGGEEAVEKARGTLLSFCHESECALWNPGTNLCGLIQPSAIQSLSEIEKNSKLF